MVDDAEHETYCIAIRLRRTTHEDSYVHVPVTDVVLRPDAAGALRVDPEALVAEAVRLSAQNSIDWALEEASTVAHPMQQPIPSGRKAFDVHSEQGPRPPSAPAS